MLTIQPNLTNVYCKDPAFKGSQDGDYVDYTEIFDTDDGVDTFDIQREKDESKKELDLWQQTKQNLDSISHTTESVPVLNKGMKVFSGLISVAIGWGGLRWGTVGTLEVMSKLGKSRLAQAVKGYASAGYEEITGLAKKGLKYIKGTSLYTSALNKLDNWKRAALDTRVGRTLTDWKKAVTTNSVYTGAVGMKDNAVAYVKKLNPKRVFIETMGVAGGGTAAVNLMGGKTIDGARQDVRIDEDGNYIVDGRRGDYSHVA